MPESLDLAALGTTFDTILQRYEVWSAPQSKYTEENLPRVNTDGYTWEDFESGLKELQSQMLQEYDPYAEVRVVMDWLCPQYLAATDKERQQIRRLVAERRTLSMLVRGYADELAAQITSANDSEKLRHALAAISMEDCRTDYRDTLTSLADLYVQAEQVGLSPLPHFQAVAELSSTQTPQGGDTPVAEMLKNFDTYAVVQERRRMGKPYRDM
jgi:hypothetical protein